MEECKHTPAVKVEGGMVVTYCKKCGKILDTKPASTNEHFFRSGSNNNGGQILHG